jgi:hypothetical protein
MAKTLLQLRTSIREWLDLDEDELPNGVCNDLVNWACNDYLRRRESRFSENSTAFSTVQYAPGYTWPVGFSKPRKLWYLDTNDKPVVLSFLNKDEFDVKYPHSAILSFEGAGLLILSGGGDLVLEGGGSLHLTGEEAPPEAFGSPLDFTMWQGKLVIGPAPSTVFKLFLDYWGLLADLVNDNDTNRMTREADQYVLFHALGNASLFGIEDERVAIWEARAARLEMSLDIEDSRMHTTPKRSQAREPG